jgi:VanZ family protein
MKMNEGAKPLLLWLPTLFWAGLIFYLSSRPDVKLPGREFYLKDKLVHAAAYAVLCAGVLLGCRTAGSRDLARGVGLLSVIAYGFLDEIHQKFVPGRLCDSLDFLADSVGAVGIFSLVYLWEGRRKRRGNEVQITEGNS